MPLTTTHAVISNRGWNTPVPWSITTRLVASDTYSGQWFGADVDINAAGNVIIVGAYNTDGSLSTTFGSAYIFTKSGTTWTEQQKLVSNDLNAGDYFGYKVAMNSFGNIAIIGAQFANISGNTQQGAAYIFTRSGTTWTQQQKLIASDGGVGFNFGSSVGINSYGNVVIIGSERANISGNTQQGAAYVFTSNGITWTQQQKLIASDGSSGAFFGNDVDINSIGNIVIIGSEAATIAGNSQQGAAYVFTSNGTTWAQQQKLTASDGTASDLFGQSVRLNSIGNIAFVGCERGPAVIVSGVGTTYPGAAYSYTSNGTTWTQQQKLLPGRNPIAISQLNFGWDIAINSAGNVNIISAPRDTVSVTSTAGSLYSYNYINNWVQQQSRLVNPLPTNSGNLFSWACTINSIGNIAVISSPIGNITNPSGGQVYVLENNYLTGNISSGQWIEQQQFIGNTFYSGSQFGQTVALNSTGDIGMTGAYQYRLDSPPTYPSSGGVYTYIYNGINWQASQLITANDAAQYDFFGYDIAMNSIGNIAIIGSPTINNSTYWRQGNAYIFTNNGTTWSQQQKITASDGTTGDQFGFSVDINATGNIAIVGAPYANISGNNQQGAAYIYTYNGTTWTQQQKLTASDGAIEDWFGYSVAINSTGNIAIISALRDNIGIFTDQGSAYVFVYNGSTWVQQQKLTASDGSTNTYFGASVNLNSTGNIAFVGATGNRSTYVFTSNGTTWTQQQKLTATGGSSGDNFGSSVATNSIGNIAIIGADGDGLGVAYGASYIFTSNGTTWTQQQKLIANVRTTTAGFGRDVAINSNGNISLIGAPGYDNTPNNDDGAIYFFTNN